LLFLCYRSTVLLHMGVVNIVVAITIVLVDNLVIKPITALLFRFYRRSRAQYRP